MSDPKDDVLEMPPLWFILKFGELMAMTDEEREAVLGKPNG